MPEFPRSAALSQKPTEVFACVFPIVHGEFIDQHKVTATIACESQSAAAGLKNTCTERVLPHAFRVSLEFLRVAAPPRGNSFFYAPILFGDGINWLIAVPPIRHSGFAVIPLREVLREWPASPVPPPRQQRWW